MFALADLSKNARAGALPLKALQGAFQRFILFYSNFRHCYPSLRHFALAIAVYTTDGDRTDIIVRIPLPVNCFLES